MDGRERVLGVVYELACGDKPRLDQAESLGAGYDQRQLHLTGSSGSAEAFTYIAAPAYIDNSLHPYDWYRQLVLWGARYHRFSDKYVGAITGQRISTDPVAARPNRYRKLLQAMEALSCRALEPPGTQLYRAVVC